MKYVIPEYRVASLKKRLETLNKRATLNRVNPILFSFSPVRNDIRERWDSDNKKSVEYSVPVVDVDIDLDTFKPISGYTFIASIEHSPNGNIIVKNAPDVEVPMEFRFSGCACDHCCVDRYRKTTYIVYNETDKTFVQVGSTCIKDYLGFDVKLIASRFEFLHVLDGYTSGDGFFKKATPVVSLSRFLRTSIAFVNRLGYVSSKIANEDHTKTPTGSDAWYASTTATPSTFEQEILDSITDETIIKANTIIEWVKTQDTTKDYFYNLNTIIKNNFVTSRTANLAASMVAVYYRATAEPKEPKVPSNWLGEVGEKVALEVTVTATYPMETRFGRGYVYRMITPEGNIVTWFTSSPKLENEKKYRGYGKIKKLDEYKGTKQTIVTRPSLVEVF